MHEYLVEQSIGRWRSSIALVLVLMAACLCSVAQSQSQPGEAATWNYDDLSTRGPSSWALIPSTVVASTPAYPTCARSRQSPLDIADTVASSTLRPLSLSWPATSNVSVLNLEGRVLRIFFGDMQGIIRDPSGDEQYQITHVDIRASSEHTFGGSHRDLEMQFMHRRRSSLVAQQPTASPSSATGSSGTAAEFLGIAVTFTSSRFGYNSLLASIIAAAGPSGTQRPVTIVNALLAGVFPPKRDYYAYEGSLTHPPCTESVRWIVVAAPAGVGDAQVARVRELLGLQPTATEGRIGNVRPSQLRGTRSILRYIDYEDVIAACPALSGADACKCTVCTDAVDRRMGVSIAALFFATVAFIVCVSLISAITSST